MIPMGLLRLEWRQNEWRVGVGEWGKEGEGNTEGNKEFRDFR